MKRLIAAAIMIAGLSIAASGPPRDYAAAPAAFEHGGSDRTSVFAAPDPFARPAEARRAQNGALRGAWNVAESADGGLFALSGVLGGPDRPTVTRLAPETLATQWQVALPLPDVAGLWNYPGAVAVHANGFVYAAYATRMAKLDPKTGAVVATVDLPAPNGPTNSTYNGFVILADGTLLAKSHHRKAGCEAQGYRAFVECGVDGVAPSVLVLIDPDTMAIRWTGAAPELIGGRVSAMRFGGATYVYLAGDTYVHRMRYTSGRLETDRRWGPVRYRNEGQTPGTAVVGFGDFVVIQNNAIPTRAPLTVTAIAQGDSSKVFTIAPFAARADHWFFMPSKVSTDWAKKRVYTAAAFDGMTALDFDPRTGFRVAWRVAQPTGSFMTIIGPPKRRVLVAADMAAATADALGAPVHQREALVWRDAQTGRELARVPDLPRNFGLTLTPDRSGAMIYPTRAEGVLRLRPATAR